VSGLGLIIPKGSIGPGGKAPILKPTAPVSMKRSTRSTRLVGAGGHCGTEVSSPESDLESRSIAVSISMSGSCEASSLANASASAVSRLDSESESQPNTQTNTPMIPIVRFMSQAYRMIGVCCEEPPARPTPFW
jgi:hypothetical protein